MQRWCVWVANICWKLTGCGETDTTDSPAAGVGGDVWHVLRPDSVAFLVGLFNLQTGSVPPCLPCALVSSPGADVNSRHALNFPLLKLWL